MFVRLFIVRCRTKTKVSRFLLSTHLQWLFPINQRFVKTHLSDTPFVFMMVPLVILLRQEASALFICLMMTKLMLLWNITNECMVSCDLLIFLFLFNISGLNLLSWMAMLKLSAAKKVMALSSHRAMTKNQSFFTFRIFMKLFVRLQVIM